MRRAPGLHELSRRDFCALASAALVGACTQGGSRAVGTGPLGSTGDDDDTGPTPDAPDHPPPDGHVVGMDAPVGVACTTTPTDVGAASTYTLNTPKYFSSGKFFVVKDSGGFYALTARCTHEGATCTVSGSDFHCPRHNALFTLNGAVISGPVVTALKHYGMCNMSNGNLGVITTMTVSASTRIEG